MDFQLLGIPAVIWVGLTSLMVLISRNWRVMVIYLALQYLGVFTLVVLRWPFELAVAKLVSGWMASAVLGIAAAETIQNMPPRWREVERTWPSGSLFRILAAGLVWLTVFSLGLKAVSWIPEIGLVQAWGGMILIGTGLLHLGLTSQPMRVITGLLTAMSGFEIIYAAVESSTLLAGLLAATHMGLALAGAYLLIAAASEDNR